ncbi:hypothetical protein BaRGS_00033653 [Batillaria attramentaria]|uniref:Uncharacterized protein n=1 Tax=Batillaria attramentaria TaxID=370345 RepID=A0ABD0JJP1_9CAEN
MKQLAYVLKIAFRPKADMTSSECPRLTYPNSLQTARTFLPDGPRLTYPNSLQPAAESFDQMSQGYQHI